MLTIKTLALAASCSFLALACSVNAEDNEVAGDAVVEATIDVAPYATFGTGNPGSGEEDINTPDGVVFNANGHLLLTDALNHRVQVWDTKAKKRLGQFGDEKIFRGEIVDLAVGPTGRVIVTDEVTNVAYAFDPPTGKEKGDLKYTAYKHVAGDMFEAEHAQKVGGITIDKTGRIYTVDARKSLVRRFDEKGTPDPTWKFSEKGGAQYLHGSEGIAIDEARGNLYVSSEQDSVVQVFDLEDGAYKGQMIGGKADAKFPGSPVGEQTFAAAVEGLWILDDYLLASDEADNGTGHIEIFDLTEKTAFDTDAAEYAKLKSSRKRSGFVGSFGSFCSPDSVAAYTDADGESYVAVADQCHYQVVIYKWSDIIRAGKIKRTK